MAKYPTRPTLFDEVLQISISKLKAFGYLKPDSIMGGNLVWSTNGKETAKIGITVNTSANFIELDYSYNKKPVKYLINLVSRPSNLGKGKVWYFECPQTKKRCVKLYCIGGYFLHREAFKGCMYEKQTKGKREREQMKMCDMVFGTDKLYEQLYGKYFKRTYAGKPTKKFTRLMQKIKRSESIAACEVERLLLPKGYKLSEK
jgi:hypothetical protein